MKLSRILGVACLGLFLLPLLFVQAQEPKGVTVSQLMRDCRKNHTSRDINIRREAVAGFYSLSSEVGNVVDSLHSALVDVDDEIRIKAAKSLSMIGPSSRPATDRLGDMLREDKNPEARVAAAGALGSIFRGGFLADYEKKAFDNLVHAMRHDPDMRVRKSACNTLGGIGRGAKDAAPDLVEVMKESKDEKMRDAAARSLGFVVGPETKSIVPALLAMYKTEKDESTHMKGTILVVLAIIGDKEEVVIPMLIDALRDRQNLKMRFAGAIGVGRLGPKGKDAVPALIDALDVTVFKDKDDAYHMRYWGLKALGNIGPAAKAAIPVIR